MSDSEKREQQRQGWLIGLQLVLGAGIFGVLLFLDATIPEFNPSWVVYVMVFGFAIGIRPESLSALAELARAFFGGRRNE
jgi:hypothetical protein